MTSCTVLLQQTDMPVLTLMPIIITTACHSICLHETKCENLSMCNREHISIPCFFLPTFMTHTNFVPVVTHKLLSRLRINNEKLKASGPDVGINFKHLKSKLRQDPDIMPSLCDQSSEQTSSFITLKTHTWKQTIIGKGCWELFFTWALPLYFCERKGGQKKLFLYLSGQGCEGRGTTKLLFLRSMFTFIHLRSKRKQRQTCFYAHSFGFYNISSRMSIMNWFLL